jgi:hypothetical protein
VQVQLVSAIGMHHMQSSQLTRDRRSLQELRRSQCEQTSTTARITSFTVHVRWQTSRALRPAANWLCRALKRPRAAHARRLHRPHARCSRSLPEKPPRCRVWRLALALGGARILQSSRPVTFGWRPTHIEVRPWPRRQQPTGTPSATVLELRAVSSLFELHGRHSPLVASFGTLTTSAARGKNVKDFV